MNNFRRYVNRFKMINGKNSEWKLILIFAIIFISIFNGFSKLLFHWQVILSLAVFLFSMTCHEVAHGYVAYIFGDDTAKREGRISFNPIKHLDLKGLMIPVILFLLNSPILFGWAKPVPVNFWRLKHGKIGVFFVAIAGIVVNFIIAIISAILLKLIIINPIFLKITFLSRFIIQMLVNLYIVNLMLGLFNLIPITPLDGGRIVHNFGNQKIKDFYNKIEKHGMIIVFLLVYIGINFGIFDSILEFFISLLGLPKYWIFF